MQTAPRSTSLWRVQSLRARFGWAKSAALAAVSCLIAGPSVAIELSGANRMPPVSASLGNPPLTNTSFAELAHLSATAPRREPGSDAPPSFETTAVAEEPELPGASAGLALLAAAVAGVLLVGRTRADD